MSNEFQEIFKIQTEFLRKVLLQKYNIDLDNISKEDKIFWTKEMILSSSKEIHELLDIMEWKTHRYQPNIEINHDNFAEQAIDAFKYLLNICILNGIDFDQFRTKYVEKSEIVDIRFEQEKKLFLSQNDTSVKYAVFDIDGVINNYPVNVRDYMGVSDLHVFKKTHRAEYRILKNKFETSGEERNNILNPETKKIIDLVSQTHKIILLTARPYEKISRLYYDTIYWLNKENIKYDYLFFSEHKEDFLIQNFNPDQIEFVVDDQIDNINKLSNTFKTFLLFNKNLYNSEDLLSVKKNVTVIENITELPISNLSVPSEVEEYMNIYAESGTKISVSETSINNGWDYDKEKAHKYLKVGEIYTVSSTEVHSWSSTVVLQEFPDLEFNTVNFISIKQ